MRNWPWRCHIIWKSRGWWKHFGEIVCKALASLTQVYNQLKLVAPVRNERYFHALACPLERKGPSTSYCLVKEQMQHFLRLCVSDVVAARFGVLWAFIILLFADEMGRKWPRLLFLLIFCGLFFQFCGFTSSFELRCWHIMKHHISVCHRAY